ncbi:phosphatase PAP2 family protein [Asanoa sp. WMMD1127]|uniref:phosphatase PAP2 family protein n=1 Tax=Asanoa sp. WMMD1127 TaxID=3016107 RepID=UPI002416628B|nr:phosphatase PAP2 family protein [Asanoa sp. WMMD1127]MDG4824011.1 phosphatase PAP2 family protein [Asanoa sp. WMMD1127]
MTVGTDTGAQPDAKERGGILQRPLEHFTARSLGGLVAVVVAGIAFGVLLALVRFKFGPLYDLDHGVADSVNGYVSDHEGLLNVIRFVTDLGGPLKVWAVVLGVAVLLIRRRIRLAVYLVIAGLGALVLDPTIKLLVGRLRPVVDVPVAHAPGNSFPSGHALGSFVVYGSLLLVFLPAVPRRWRPAVIAAVGTLVALIGVSRIALGVHFVSDVLAGWLLGAAWLGITLYAFRLWRREDGRPEPALTEGLEPEAAQDLKPAPTERAVLHHPWVGLAEVLVGWVLVLGALFGFGMWASYHADGTVIAALDDAVPRWFAEHRTPMLDGWSHWASKAGDTHTILAVSLVFCTLVLARWRQWRPILFLTLVMIGELTLFLSSAAAVNRPRPDVPHLDQNLPTAAFPSGHIAATLCLWTTIALIVMARTDSWWRWLSIVAAVVMPVIVTTSRFYRGMHHPSDLMGALMLTALWVGLLFVVLRPNAEAVKADAGDDLQHQDRGVRRFARRSA